jgi:hypothetical protein
MPDHPMTNEVIPVTKQTVIFLALISTFCTNILASVAEDGKKSRYGKIE